MLNVSDDYNTYWQVCSKCNCRWHPAEQDCQCEQCEKCLEWFAPRDLMTVYDGFLPDMEMCHRCYEDLD